MRIMVLYIFRVNIKRKVLYRWEEIETYFFPLSPVSKGYVWEGGEITVRCFPGQFSHPLGQGGGGGGHFFLRRGSPFYSLPRTLTHPLDQPLRV
jgi:hypothetical protein